MIRPSHRGRRLAPWLFAPLALCFLVACGEGDVGDECGDSGDPDECVDGALCTNESDSDDDDGAVCRALCEEHEDCPSSERCNGVSGSNLKTCQPDADEE